MGEFLNAARKSIEEAERVLEDAQQRDLRRFPNGGGLSNYHQRRTELTEQWLKLAAIEQGLNPFQTTSQADAENGQRSGGGW